MKYMLLIYTDEQSWADGEREKEQLTRLLRKLMLWFEARESAAK